MSPQKEPSNPALTHYQQYLNNLSRQPSEYPNPASHPPNLALRFHLKNSDGSYTYFKACEEPTEDDIVNPGWSTQSRGTSINLHPLRDDHHTGQDEAGNSVPFHRRSSSSDKENSPVDQEEINDFHSSENQLLAEINFLRQRVHSLERGLEDMTHYCSKLGERIKAHDVELNHLDQLFNLLAKDIAEIGGGIAPYYHRPQQQEIPDPRDFNNRVDNSESRPNSPEVEVEEDRQGYELRIIPDRRNDLDESCEPGPSSPVVREGDGQNVRDRVSGFSFVTLRDVPQLLMRNGHRLNGDEKRHILAILEPKQRGH